MSEISFVGPGEGPLARLFGHELALLVIDPACRSARVWLGTMAAGPPALHDRCLAFRLSTDHDGAIVAKFVAERGNELLALARGRNAEGIEGMQFDIDELPQYWDAGDWMARLGSPPLMAIAAAIDAGEGYDQALSLASERIAKEAREQGELVCARDLRSWLDECMRTPEGGW